MEEMMTGDVLYRKSDALGPFCIPFSKLVAILSKSLYSHASIVVKENGFTNVLDVGEHGITKLPLEKWECWCVEQAYSVYRLREGANKDEIVREVNQLIDSNPEYNFTFDDPDKVYCTESVVKIYERAGHKDIFVPVRIKDVVPFWVLCIIKPISGIIKLLTGKGLSFSEPLYFVGNEDQGMMSSVRMHKIKDVYLN